MNASISPWAVQSAVVAALEPDSYAAPREGLGRDALWAAETKRLFEEKNKALVHFLTALLHSTQDAREVAQEAYEWLLRNRDDPRVLNWHDPLELLLFGVARGIARNRADRRRNHERIQRQLLCADDTLQGQVPAPERHCAAREEIAIIKRSLAELPPVCRQVFILARVEGIRVEEIARRMDLSVRSVWRLIAQAMAHCRKRLDPAEQTRSRIDKERRLTAAR